MKIQSPIQDRSCIDFKETSRIHCTILLTLLGPHTLRGCGSIVATYEVGKIKAIFVTRTGFTLDQIGKPMADIIKIS